ncbi:hypothetical protein I9H06_10880 [Pseudomonas tremae]|uniref:DUF6338 family protein n=1 Tax=Pseudomonas tremae TaxID=200454 RepID=UPI001F22AC00|nr:DUF6338 family protein [Pseudomonas tremae]MCF5715465.1 hypothetical protein [Pseudomonas tremae]UQB33697.1 hypothetical protein I9H06_10880 [Pseudomonas tremae]
MDIWAADKLVLFIAFVIPGFLSIKFYQLIFPGTVRNASDQLVDAVAYSCINYALLFWAVVYVEDHALRAVHPVLYYLFYVFVLFVSPFLLVLTWKWLRTHEKFKGSAPHPTAKPWDYVFKQAKPYWIVVYLKNGKMVGGKYSGQSFASSYPVEEQIFLEEAWIVNADGILDRAIKGSAGVLVMASEISYLEFSQYQPGDGHVR